MAVRRQRYKPAAILTVRRTKSTTNKETDKNTEDDSNSNPSTLLTSIKCEKESIILATSSSSSPPSSSLVNKTTNEPSESDSLEHVQNTITKQENIENTVKQNESVEKKVSNNQHEQQGKENSTSKEDQNVHLEECLSNETSDSLTIKRNIPLKYNNTNENELNSTNKVNIKTEKSDNNNYSTNSQTTQSNDSEFKTPSLLNTNNQLKNILDLDKITSPVNDMIITQQFPSASLSGITLSPQKDNSYVDDQIKSPISTKIRQRIRPTPCFSFRRNSTQGSVYDADDEPKRQRNHSTSSNYSIPYTNNANSSGNSSGASIGRNITNIVTSTNRIRTESTSSNMSDYSSMKDSSIRSKRTLRSDEYQHVSNAKKAFHTNLNGKMPDRTKLRMMDMIYYNPLTNPMKSSSIKIEKKEHTISTSSTSASQEPIEKSIKTEKSPEKPETKPNIKQEPSLLQENAMPVPQLKLGPNGEIVLDEQSLVIESTGDKIARETLANSEIIYDDDISGHTGFYKRHKRSKEWLADETIKFYRCLHTIGTDFSLMISLFPNRTRRDLKIKFKKEEKRNLALINKALLYPKTFNIDELKVEFEKEAQETDEKAKKWVVDKPKREKKRREKINLTKTKTKSRQLSRAARVMADGDLTYEYEFAEVPKRKKWQSKKKESQIVKSELPDSIQPNKPTNKIPRKINETENVSDYEIPPRKNRRVTSKKKKDETQPPPPQQQQQVSKIITAEIPIIFTSSLSKQETVGMSTDTENILNSINFDELERLETTTTIENDVEDGDVEVEKRLAQQTDNNDNNLNESNIIESFVIKSDKTDQEYPLEETLAMINGVSINNIDKSSDSLEVSNITNSPDNVTESKGTSDSIIKVDVGKITNTITDKENSNNAFSIKMCRPSIDDNNEATSVDVATVLLEKNENYSTALSENNDSSTVGKVSSSCSIVTSSSSIIATTNTETKQIIKSEMKPIITSVSSLNIISISSIPPEICTSTEISQDHTDMSRNNEIQSSKVTESPLNNLDIENMDVIIDDSMSNVNSSTTDKLEHSSKQIVITVPDDKNNLLNMIMKHDDIANIIDTTDPTQSIIINRNRRPNNNTTVNTSISTFNEDSKQLNNSLIHNVTTIQDDGAIRHNVNNNYVDKGNEDNQDDDYNEFYNEEYDKNNYINETAVDEEYYEDDEDDVEINNNQNEIDNNVISPSTVLDTENNGNELNNVNIKDENDLDDGDDDDSDDEELNLDDSQLICVERPDKDHPGKILYQIHLLCKETGKLSEQPLDLPQPIIERIRLTLTTERD